MKKKIVYISMVAIAFFACKKDLEEMKTLEEKGAYVVPWNPTFVAPLIDTKTTLGQAYEKFTDGIKRLEDEGIKLKIRNDGVFEASYDYTYETGGMNKYYTIPTKTQKTSLKIPQYARNTINTLPVGASLDKVWDSTFYVDIEAPYGAELEFIETSAGKIDLALSHDLNQNLGLQVTFKSIKNISTGQVLGASLTNSGDVSKLRLNNHRVNLTYIDQSNVARFNRFEVYVKTTGTSTSKTLTGNGFDLDVTIGDYYLKYIKGFLGIFDAELATGNDKFDFFEDNKFEGIFFSEPKMKFKFESTVGMPMKMVVEKMEFGYPNGSIEQILKPNQKSVYINGVSNIADIPNNPTITNDFLDKDNSRIAELLNSQPNSVMYKLDFKSTTDIVGKKNSFFLKDTSQVRIISTAELPMIFSVFDYSYKDTFDLDFSKIDKEYADFKADEDLDSLIIEKAQIKLTFETQLPFDVRAQGYFIDAKGVIIDSVFLDSPHTVLANNDLSSDGSVLGVKKSETILELDQVRFDKIVKAKKMIIRANGKTSNAKKNEPVFVRLKSNYQFGVKLGVLAKFKYAIPRIDFN